MWPNDADGNAIRAALGPLLEKAGYTIVDPGAYEDGTTDYSAQIAKFKRRGLRDLQHLPDPARLRDVLAPGRAAGADQADQDRPDRQDRPVPLAGRGARRARLQPRERRLLAPDVPVHVVAHRASRTRSSPPATRRRPASSGTSSSAPSLALFDVGVAALKASGEPEGQGGGRERDEDARRSPRRSGISTGARARCRTSSQTPIIGGQWVKAKSGKFKFDLVFCEHSDDPNVPIAGQAAAVQRLDSARSWGRTSTPILAAAGIHKRFGALVVLDGVDFSVGAGEAVGIVGPNGAGKTTLLNVLSGALRPSRGHGRVPRRRTSPAPASSSAAGSGIGRAHQMPRPFGGMTVFENVFVGAATGGGLRGAGRLRRAASRRSSSAAWSTLANRRAETLGLLDRKRLELARALGNRPGRAAARRDRRRLTDAEADELVDDDPRAARARHRDRLDRAHRPRARPGRRAAGLPGRRPGHRRRRARTT